MASCRQIDINHCAECHQLDKANIFNCRWLQFNFCKITCLKQFYAKIVVACDLCERKFDQNNRVHVRDDVPIGNSYTFICEECLGRRSALATHCHYCTKRCYRGFDAQLMTTTGVGAVMKYRCSSDCQAKVKSRKSELTVCLECDKLSKCEDISYNGRMYAICSAVCLENLTQKNGVSFENCDKCRIKFAFNGGYRGAVDHEHIVVDRIKRKVFCSEDCVYAYVRDDAELVVCCMCRHRMPYYKCMRRSYDDRCFCSLGCIQAAEQNIEQLLQNDEQFHLDILNLKCKSQLDDDDDSDMESSDFNQDCRLLDDSHSSIECNSVDDALRPSSALIAAVAAKSADAKAAMQETPTTTTTRTTTTTIIPSELLERLLIAPKLQTTHNSSGIMGCALCQSNMASKLTIIQWEWLEFCDSQCFELFFLKYSASGCTICSKDCDFYCGLPSAHVYGSQLYLFCTDQCADVFFKSASFCKFCHRIADPAKILNGFCQTKCQEKFEALYTDTTLATAIKEIGCNECSTITNTNIRLSFAGDIYDFCSFPCYFHRYVQCEIFPEQCTMCQIYFVRDACSKVSFTFRQGNTVHVFCSQSCQSHFIYKYQFVETCTICRQCKSNIKMIKNVITDTLIHLSYCSMSCVSSVGSSYAMELAFFSDRQQSSPTIEKETRNEIVID